ncbi:MAG: hypothetical protein QM768_17535 [Agriterribacter sp.]
MNFGSYSKCLCVGLLMAILMFLSTTSYSQLVYKKILSSTISVKLPFSFKVMDANTLSSKYQTNNKPSEVYTNEEATVNIAFKKTTQLLSEQNVFVEGKKIEQQLTSNGKVQLISSGQVKTNKNNIYVFSFYSDAIDTRVYNVMFIFSLKGKMILGSFNCTMALQNQWQDAAYEIIRSVEVI